MPFPQCLAFVVGLCVYLLLVGDSSEPQCSLPANYEVRQPLAAGRAYKSASVSIGCEELQCSRGLGLQGPCGLSRGRVRCCF